MNCKHIVLCLICIPTLSKPVFAEDRTLATQCMEDGGKSCQELLKACNKKEIARACTALGYVRAKQKDGEFADYYRKGCRLGDKEACKLIDLYESELSALKEKRAGLEKQLAEVKAENDARNTKKEDLQNAIKAIQSLSSSENAAHNKKAIEAECKSTSTVVGGKAVYTNIHCEQQQ
nr:hypothetical protein [uncultured Bdellovibrio sp.]